jgi:histidinol phosphatase-like PHP family hydrolase
MTVHKVQQDLHIHTVFSSNDGAIVPQQTIETVAFVNHAELIGISDHFEHFMPQKYNEYYEAVKSYGFKVGTEIDGNQGVPLAIQFEFDYYIYHCWGGVKEDYLALNDLIRTGKPVIIAHPYATDTDLKKIPESCYVEINNRYIWRYDWRKIITPFKEKFRWVISSDAHKPIWLNQNIALRVAEELGIEESILFKKNKHIPVSACL